LTVNALTAADALIVPLQCEYFALRGLDALIDIVARVQRRLNPQLELIGIVPTMYNPRRSHDQVVLKQVRSAFPNKLLDVVIKESVRLAEAPAAKRSILELDPRHEIAQAYRNLAEVIINARSLQSETAPH
jgi:chromosome partitioning protein